MMILFQLAALCALFITVPLTRAQNSNCPYDSTDLKKWSDQSFGDEVVIPTGTSILLDAAAVDVKNIKIMSGASLVFSDSDTTVRTQYIHVLGSMILGSEDCPLTADIEITLKGDPGDYSIAGFGEKFIGVDSGATLEIHGEYKLPWTKLDDTVIRLEDGLVDKIRNVPSAVDSKGHDTFRGVVAYVMDTATGKIEQIIEGVNGFEHNQCLLDNKAKEFEEKMKAVPDGKIIGIAVKRQVLIHPNRDLAIFYEMIERFAYGQVTKTTSLRKYKLHGTWAMIYQKGDTSSVQEDLVLDEGKDLERAVELYIVANNMKFSIRSWVHTIRRGQCYTEAKVSQAAVSIPTISLIDDVDTWEEGDTIALLSTDFDWRQTEEATVVSCDSCQPNEIQVDIEPKFTHYGQIVKNVDMRGEVAVLNRNIVIRGEPTTKSKTFGGHLKILKGFQNVHIENAEFANMGQQDSIGNYPIHFHMCEDIDNVTDPAYVRGNSIHDSFSRCLTVHGTSGLLVKDNVCLRSMGHGFFLEDGGEKRTVFDGNLGAGQTRGFLLPTDFSMEATFWITNPNTVMRNNVAAGSDSIGIWFLYPDKPIGPSADKNFSSKFESQHTAITEFNNNVVHSNARTGLFIENKLLPNNKASGTNRYEPWNDPLDSTSGDKMVDIVKLTAYKNIKQNAWIDGGLFTVSKSSFSDSITGLTFVRSSSQVQFVKESVFLGDSPNIGQPSRVTNGRAIRTYSRSVPLSMLNQPRQGFVYYDGPVHVSDSWFGMFEKTADYELGALAFQRANLGHGSPASTAEGLQFGFKDPDNGNRVFDGNSTDAGFSDLDGDFLATFRDLDGSVTNKAGSQVVKPIPFLLNSDCKTVDNWKMAICPQLYGQLAGTKCPESCCHIPEKILTRWRKAAKSIIVSRDDDPDSAVISADQSMGAPFMTILGGSYSYLMRYDGNMPSQTVLFPYGISKSAYVRLALCVPTAATLDVRMRGVSGWKRGAAVDSVQELEESDEINNYYYNSTVGVVFLKMTHENDFSSSDITDCPGNVCSVISVVIKSGDLKESDCSDKYKETYTSSGSSGDLQRRSFDRLFTFEERSGRRKRSFDTVHPDPPSEWGAGASRTRAR